MTSPMAYAQIDVHAPQHPKVVGLSDPAFRLWVTGLCYAQAHLTDGFLAETVLPVLMRKPRLSVPEELVSAGLWERQLGGWVIHDYTTWNRSREQVQKRREYWRKKRDREGGKDGGPESGPGGTVGTLVGTPLGTLTSSAQGTQRCVPGDDPIRSTNPPIVPPDGGTASRSKRRRTGQVAESWRCPHTPPCMAPAHCTLRLLKDQEAHTLRVVARA